MNKVILCGRLTAKPELRYTGSNKPYARFTLAVNRPKQQDKEQETDFINCISWGKQGEVLAKYLDKGSPLLINGRILTGSFTDEKGIKRYTTDIVVEEFEFISAKKKEERKEKTNDPFAEFGNDLDDNYLE